MKGLCFSIFKKYSNMYVTLSKGHSPGLVFSSEIFFQFIVTVNLCTFDNIYFNNITNFTTNNKKEKSVTCELN